MPGFEAQAWLGRFFYPAPWHGSARSTLSVLAGKRASKCVARGGRSVRAPPQFGHSPAKVSAHAAQNVHSKLQILASLPSGARSRPQHSQLGRSASTATNLR
jgi:hypothetical protein